MKRSTEQLTAQERAQARLKIIAKGGDPTTMTDADMREALGKPAAGDNAPDEEGSDPDANASPNSPAATAGDEGDEGDVAKSPPPPGANDNPLDKHIREIAREEVQYHADIVDHAPAVDVDMIVKQVEKRLTKTITVVVKRPDRPPVEIADAHPMLGRVLQVLNEGINVALVGPAGCGKSFLADQVAKAMERALYPSGPALNKYEYTGFVDANGTYQPTNVYRAVLSGGINFVDEFDGSYAGAALTLNPVFDRQRTVNFPCGTVEKHADLVSIVAMNTYALGADTQFIGRNRLDDSTRDRFAFIPVTYNEAGEAKWSGNPTWTKHCQRLRAAAQKLKVKHTISTRAIVEGAQLLAASIPQKEVEDMLVWRGLESATIDKIRSAV